MVPIPKELASFRWFNGPPGLTNDAKDLTETTAIGTLRITGHAPGPTGGASGHFPISRAAASGGELARAAPARPPMASFGQDSPHWMRAKYSYFRTEQRG